MSRDKNTHFGTTTSRVTRYSELSTKCSFLTMSARLLVSRLPLEAQNSVAVTQRQVEGSSEILEFSISLYSFGHFTDTLFLMKNDQS